MRRGSRFLALASCLLLVLGAEISHPLPAGAQQSPQSLPAPSRLRVSTDKYSVSLTWVDAEAGASAYAVYRSAEPFAAGGLARAEKVGTVAVGTGTYRDEPPGGAKWYYAVLALDPLGKPYEVFAKMTTVTGAAVSVETRAAPAQPAAAAATPPAQAAPAAVPAPAPATESGAAPAAAVPQAPATETKPPETAKAAPATEAPVAAAPDKTAVPESKAVEAVAPAPASVPEAGPAAGQGPAATAPPALAVVREEPLDDGSIAVSDRGMADNQAGIVPPILLQPPREAPLPFYLYGSQMPARPSKDSGKETSTNPELSKAIAALVSGPGEEAGPSMPSLVLPGLAEGQGPRDELDRTMVDADQGGDWKMAKAFLQSYLASPEGGRDPAATDRARLYLGIALVKLGQPHEALYELGRTSDALLSRESQPWIRYAIESLRRAEGAAPAAQTLTE